MFQLESPGMRRYVRELRPTSVSTSRPWSPSSARARWTTSRPTSGASTARRQVTYLHPLLEPYLKKTYGIFVYQEDIMAAAMALGGFTGPEADTLGYAIRKKKSDVLRAQKEKFVERAAERGVPPQIIDAVFKAFEPFERYGFNKAHATCYGLIAYQTAYLKANYTVEYMASVLTAFRDSTEKVAAAIAECRRWASRCGRRTSTQSGLDFTVEGDAIRFGLLAIKNVGQGAIESIVAARAEGGRLPLARRLLQPDRPAPRQPARAGVPGQGRCPERDRPSGAAARCPRRRPRRRPGRPARPAHRPGFALRLSARTRCARTAAAADIPDAPPRERLRWEKELLGLYLSDHPLGEHAGRDRRLRQRLLGRARRGA